MTAPVTSEACIRSTGYVQVRGADAADLDPCRRALVDAGCAEVVVDGLVSGDGGQPELEALLRRLRWGDVLVVPDLRRLAASPADMVRWVQRLTSAGVGLRSLAEALDATLPAEGPPGTTGHRVAADRTSRTRQPVPGGAIAPVSGRRSGGRPPKLSREQQRTVADEVLSGRVSAVRMARRFGVSEATVSRIVSARRRSASASPARIVGGPSGNAGSRILGVLPATATHERFAIVGTSGSGKTYAAKGLLERVMVGGGRVCVVDPLGVWWGLARDAAGGAPPFPVAVFGGTHADVPLTPDMGTVLGHLVATQPMACVVDVSDLGSPSTRRAFMTEFTEALYEGNSDPLHLVLDEADLWAPQRVHMDGYDLLGRVEEIVRRGRVRGFVPWLITQRPAVLNKDVLSQADVLVSMKLTSSQDRAAVGRWIDGQADRAEGRRILAALPRLDRGEGWVWAPANGVLARVSFPLISTLDTSQAPGRVERTVPPPVLPPLDLAAIRLALARPGS